VYLEKPVSFLEQEMVVNELLLNVFGHAKEWIVTSLVGAAEAEKRRTHLSLHRFVLLLSEAGIERVPLQAPATAHARTDDMLPFWIQIDKGIDIPKIRGWVSVVLPKSTVVLLNDGVKELSKDAVSVSIRGIHSNPRVMVFKPWEM